MLIFPKCFVGGSTKARLSYSPEICEVNIADCINI